ncbi:LysR family transcriptional regulator [Sorangium sp. So ce136]|uniref:LysR family transcriptional regulator n=1 Tax=Sorangium sp. So ce136 TaxID=3133284 RepID=UPI003F0CEF6B
MDKFAAMQAFVRVVEGGTFTRAADSLGLPKTTVTRLIQQLEDQLRTRLLHRTTRRVTVTPEGVAYYERALRMLAELEELESSMDHARMNPRGRLRVDVPGALGRRFLIPALPDFHARHPDIQIDLGVTDRVVDVIGDNIDCVIRGGRVLDESLVARRIGEFVYMSCATPGYVARCGAPEHPLELARDPHTVVSYFSPITGRLIPFVLRRGAERVEVQGRCIVSMNDSCAYLDAGLAGLGAMIAPAFLARPHLDRGELVPLLEDWTPDPKPIHVVYPRSKTPSARLRVFVDWVIDRFAREPLLQPRGQPLAALSPPRRRAKAG